MPLLEDIAVKDQGAFLIQYNRLEKTRCEIYNFTSPTLRVIRFLAGEAEWRIDQTIHVFRPGDIVLLSNLNRRNIHRLLTPSITYEVFSYYLSCLSNERLWGVYYGRNHLIAGGAVPAPRACICCWTACGTRFVIRWTNFRLLVSAPWWI